MRTSFYPQLPEIGLLSWKCASFYPQLPEKPAFSWKLKMFNPLQPEIRSNFWPVEDSGGRIVVGRAPSAEYTVSADYRSNG
jgi:hypothetical protein